MRTGAVILSSGARAGQQALEPMQVIGSISAAQRLIMTFHLAGIDSIAIIVAAEDEQKMLRYAGRNGVELLPERAPDADMFDNVKLGLWHLRERCDVILVTPVDIPLFSVKTVRKLLDCGAALAVPVCDDRTGHPLRISRAAYTAILAYEGGEGLRGAVKSSGIPRVQVAVADEGVHIHSNQFEECEKIVTTHNRDQWRPVTKVQIAKESSFLGPGSWQLLSFIETTGSVRLACEEMKISYSKAWKMLNNLEKQAGFHVIVRKHGGKNGGETYLTEEGRVLLEQFEAYEQECNQAVSKIFMKYFGQEWQPGQRQAVPDDFEITEDSTAPGMT